MIVDQPFGNALGYEIITNLQSGNYLEFRFVVAYAKVSGVNRLLPYMRHFIATGGHIRGVVGIDQRNTSYEALVSLLSVCDELYVYHSEDSSRTFHVKAYRLCGPNEAWLAIGSNNLTAGGLFSNYEASISLCPDEQDNITFNTLFERYTNIASPCCMLLDQVRVQLLLDRHYVEREVQLARQRLNDAHQRARRQEEILFGRDIAVNLPRIPQNPEMPVQIQQIPEIPAQIPHAVAIDEQVATYLIRFVPRAGGRSRQVHFTLDILENYFGMNHGDLLSLQQINDIYTPHAIEHRRIVLSEANRNVRIEVAGAEILNDHYPNDVTVRPILVFKRINPTFYEYMLLMEGNPGYTELNARLHNLDWHSRSLPYEILDANAMLNIWGDCPML